ncbi:hypothetical protein SAY86_016796 [Trapa natans]|uniref:Protein kinase domain-containing protein n=1 Tax=Trapa natans TaxID=22666 RepID=A0AAN7LPE3_TRANT|nr:hypothetical protein SAY86_016796 [Trapa natans]
MISKSPDKVLGGVSTRNSSGSTWIAARMEKNWKISRLKDRGGDVILMLIFLVVYLSMSSCWCLNEEGLALLRFRDRIENDPFGALRDGHEYDGETDPCLWFGIECSNEKVVALHQLSDRNVDCFGTENFNCRRRLAQFAPENPQLPLPINDNGQLPQLPPPDQKYDPGPTPPPDQKYDPGPTPPPDQNYKPSSPTLSKYSPPWMVIGMASGGSALLFFIILGIYLYRKNKVTMIRSWATVLSGQLQKAFITDVTPTRDTGVLKLKRSELVIACEDFSNVVGTSSIGTIYKGTLSSGAEIAVASVAGKSASDWSMSLETQFRNKIKTLSQMNHKNFVNLLGYCQEDEPFTRMMVFEYAPNGTLFEHLHVKEAEHLYWGTRMRIAMGMAYCLEHMHQLDPPVPHNGLTSSAVILTEDYAAKISDFNFLNQVARPEMESTGIELVENSSAGPERNVHSFGVVLFEIVTGRIPYTMDNGFVRHWTSDFVRGDRLLGEMVDPTLGSFVADQVEKIGEIIRSCACPDPKHRPSMREVSSRLRDVTGIPPDAAVSKISPLWWAELEVLSTQGD